MRFFDSVTVQRAYGLSAGSVVRPKSHFVSTPSTVLDLCRLLAVYRIFISGYVNSSTCCSMNLPPCVREIKPCRKRKWDEGRFCHHKQNWRVQLQKFILLVGLRCSSSTNLALYCFSFRSFVTTRADHSETPLTRARCQTDFRGECSSVVSISSSSEHSMFRFRFLV